VTARKGERVVGCLAEGDEILPKHRGRWNLHSEFTTVDIFSGL